MRASSFFTVERQGPAFLLRLESQDGTNRLTRDCVLSLTDAVAQLSQEKMALIITGNDRFFSAGADLAEIVALNGPSAYEFSRMGSP